MATRGAPLFCGLAVRVTLCSMRRVATLARPPSRHQTLETVVESETESPRSTEKLDETKGGCVHLLVC